MQILRILREIILCLEVALVGGHVFPKSEGESVVGEGVSLEAFLDGDLVGIGILPFHKSDGREDQLGHALRALGHTISSFSPKNVKGFLKCLHLRMFRDQGQMLQALQPQPEGNCCKQRCCRKMRECLIYEPKATQILACYVVIMLRDMSDNDLVQLVGKGSHIQDRSNKMRLCDQEEAASLKRCRDVRRCKHCRLLKLRSAGMKKI